MSAYVMAARRLGVPIPPNLAGMMAPTIGLGLPVPAVAVRSVMPAARPGAATTQYSRPAFVQRNQASNFFANLYGPQNPALPTNPGATGTTPSTPAPNSNGTAVVSSKRANKSSNVASQSNSQTGPRCETLQYVAPSKLSSGLHPNSFKVPGKKCNLSEECAICIDPLSGSKCVQLAVCGHIFHRGCVKQAFKVSQSCPVCRKVSCWTDVKSLRSCCYANHV